MTGTLIYKHYGWMWVIRIVHGRYVKWIALIKPNMHTYIIVRRFIKLTGFLVLFDHASWFGNGFTNCLASFVVVVVPFSQETDILRENVLRFFAKQVFHNSVFFPFHIGLFIFNNLIRLYNIHASGTYLAKSGSQWILFRIYAKYRFSFSRWVNCFQI